MYYYNIWGNQGVSIHWTGLLDWNTGLDYWSELFSFSGQVCMFIFRKKPMFLPGYNGLLQNNNNSCLLQCFHQFSNAYSYIEFILEKQLTIRNYLLIEVLIMIIPSLAQCPLVDIAPPQIVEGDSCSLASYYLWLNHATSKIGQKKTNTIGTIQRLSFCLNIYNLFNLLNEYSVTSGLCTGENTAVNNHNCYYNHSQQPGSYLLIVGFFLTETCPKKENNFSSVIQFSEWIHFLHTTQQSLLDLAIVSLSPTL